MGTHSWNGNNPPTEADCERFGYEEGSRWSAVFSVRPDAGTQAKSELAMLFADDVDIVRLNGIRMVMAYCKGFVNGLDQVQGGKPSTMEEKLSEVIGLLRDQSQRALAAPPQ